MGLFKDLLMVAGEVIASEVGKEVSKEVGKEIQGIKDFAKQICDEAVKFNASRDRLLMRAALKGDLSQVIDCLNRGASVNGPAGDSPLIAACMTGHTHIARYLIGRGADVNRVTDAGLSPLIWACGRRQFTEKMLEGLEDEDKKINEEAVNVLEESLALGPYRDHSDLVQLLLENGAKANARDKSGLLIPLSLACTEGNVNIVELLLNHGADVNATNPDGVTALYIACENDNTAIVKLLLDQGANPNLRAKDGRTPLMLTCFIGNLNNLCLFLGGEPNITEESKQINDSLVEYNRHRWQIAKWLIEKGADLNARMHNGTTALMVAATSGSEDLVKLLLDYGANVGIVTNNGISAIDLAQASGFQDIAVLLRRRL